VSLRRKKQPPFVDARDAQLDSQRRRREWLDLFDSAAFFVVWFGGSFLAEWAADRLGASPTASYYVAIGWFIGFPLLGLWWDGRPLRRQERRYKRAVRAWRASRPTLPEQFRNGGFNDWRKTEECTAWLAKKPERSTGLSGGSREGGGMLDRLLINVVRVLGAAVMLACAVAVVVLLVLNVSLLGWAIVLGAIVGFVAFVQIGARVQEWWWDRNDEPVAPSTDLRDASRQGWAER
jgi:hypothetical protein